MMLIINNMYMYNNMSEIDYKGLPTKSEDLSVVVLSFLSYFFFIFIILFLSHYLRSVISLPFFIGSFTYLVS